MKLTTDLTSVTKDNSTLNSFHKPMQTVIPCIVLNLNTQTCLVRCYPLFELIYVAIFVTFPVTSFLLHFPVTFLCGFVSVAFSIDFISDSTIVDFTPTLVLLNSFDYTFASWNRYTQLR